MKNIHVYKRNPDYISRKIVDEYVLVPIHQNVANMDCIYTLNDVGALVWEVLETPTSLPTIIDLVSNEYEADIETIQEDLSTFLQEMEECGAVLKVNGK